MEATDPANAENTVDALSQELYQDEPEEGQNVEDMKKTAFTKAMFVPATSEGEPVKLDHLHGKSPPLGLPMARFSELEKDCAIWFPVASAVDACAKLKPEAPKENATHVVTLHNYAGFVHVVRALAEVLPEDAIVWLAALSDGSSAFSVSIDLETRAWSEATKCFDVDGKSGCACPICRHGRALPACECSLFLLMTSSE